MKCYHCGQEMPESEFERTMREMKERLDSWWLRLPTPDKHKVKETIDKIEASSKVTYDQLKQVY